jgi:hypothetical protein
MILTDGHRLKKRPAPRRPPTTARYAFWWPHVPILDFFFAGTRLAVALPRPAQVHWSHGGCRNAIDELTHDSGFGFHVAALDVRRFPPWGAHRIHLAVARERRLAAPRLSGRGNIG